MITDKKNHLLITPVVSTFLLAAILLALFTVYMVFEMRWSGPFRDTWEFVGFIEQLYLGKLSWSELFAAYGGAHRIAIPKLLFYLDFRYFHASNYLTSGLSIFLQALSFLIYRYLIFSEEKLSVEIKIALCAAALFFLFSTTQLFNLLYAMDCQWYISTTCALMAFAILVKTAKPGYITIVLCLALAIAASFSNSTGLFIWPLLMAALYTRKLPIKTIFMLSVACLVFIYFYTQQLYVETGEPLVNNATEASSTYLVLMNLPATIYNMLRYLGFYLCSPLSRSYPTIGWFLSMLMVGFLIRFWYACIFKKYRPGNLSLLAACLAGYIVLAGLATSWGRMYYPNSSTAERFQTIVLQFQFAMLLLVVCEFKQFTTRQNILCKNVLVLLFPLIMIGSAQVESAKETASLNNRVYTSHTALISGITSINAAKGTLSHPLLINKVNLFSTYHEFLERKKLGAFYDWPANLLNKPFALKEYGSCKGKVFSRNLIDEDDLSSGYKLKGRAINERTLKPYKDLIFVDENKIVIGFGRLDRRKRWLWSLIDQKAETSTWTGYIPSSAAFPEVLIYAIDHSRSSVCLIDRSSKNIN